MLSEAKHLKLSRDSSAATEGSELQFKQGGFDNAVLRKTWRDAEQASHLVPPRWRRTRVQKRRHLLRARSYDGRFQRSIFNHVPSAAAHAGAQCKAPQMRGAEESH